MVGAILLYVGGIFAMVLVHSKNITRLWDLKQDKTVCDPTHDAIRDDIMDIKENVRWLRDKKENGG